MAPRLETYRLNARAARWLDDLPPILHDEPEFRAIYYVYARECELMDQRIAEIRAQAVPTTAGDAGLRLWEQRLRMPLGYGNVEARRAAVIQRIAALRADPAGQNWIERVNGRLGPGVIWSYEEHIPGDGGSPAVQTLRISLPFESGSDALKTAQAAIREETPAELAITWTTTSGFLVEVSELDVEELGG